jgi:hypothetical protein
MRPRKRVSLRESFKIAGRGSLEGGDSVPLEASLGATILFGIWWWIAGVPVNKNDKH